MRVRLWNLPAAFRYYPPQARVERILRHAMPPGWFKALTRHSDKESKHGGKDKSGGCTSPSGSGRVQTPEAEEKHSDDCNSNLRSSEVENLSSESLPEDQGGHHQPDLHEDEISQRPECDKPPVQGDSTSETDNGLQPQRIQEIKDLRDGQEAQKKFFHEKKPETHSDTCLRDHEKLHGEGHEFPKRSNTIGENRGWGLGRWNSVDSTGVSPRKVTHLAKFDFLLLSWPKLKSASVEKHRYEARLLKLMEVETEIVVIGEEPIHNRWSLGIIDDGVKALGKAIDTRGYPKLQKLCIERCRLILETPFATLARAFTASNLPNLEEISFQHVSFINNAGFVELAKAFKNGGPFSKLRTLILMDNGMQDEGLLALTREGFGSGNLSNLKKLRVGRRSTEKSNREEFHLEAAREFSKEVSSSGHLPQLEDLRFSGCVEPEGVICVIEALKTRLEGAVTCLDLSDSSLDGEGIRVLASASEAPQFSSLLSLKLDVTVEAIPVLLEAFHLRNLHALQRITLSGVCLGEMELMSLAVLLEAKHLPGLLEFSAPCSEITVASAMALVRAYENNDCLVARLNIGQWPTEKLQAAYHKSRNSNLELDELV
ncbi:hypothetical protein R1sor_005862 [Riccia sorocarpa]|uniref:Uncharacterized protein n=1 Tax=Riccia sorocarpa TaxID=122646 RepID=A0ABD3HN34_9MARC